MEVKNKIIILVVVLNHIWFRVFLLETWDSPKYREELELSLHDLGNS